MRCYGLCDRGATPESQIFDLRQPGNEKEDKEKKMTDREQYTPGPARGAQVRQEGEKLTLILVRELRHPPEKVWQALTDPAHLGEWAPFNADGSLGTVGAKVKLTTVGAPMLHVTETRVTRADAPTVLEYNWGDFNIRWQLEPLDGGTRLTLWTNIGRPFIAMGAAGWHICFDVLDHLLSGAPIGRMVGPEAMKFGGWQRLTADYAKQLAQQLRAIKEELENARQMQLSILPREIPKIAGLDIAARYVPMTSVAGDFYDFIEVDDKRLGVLVADVSGHGMPAALISSMLKIALAAQSEQARDPAGVLTGLNRALCGKFEGRYVTAAYALVDMEKKSICYAGAGHPPLVLRDESGGNTREITENGLFLGSFPNATYSAVEMPFNEGDWAVLYTDGILEATAPSLEQFGADRLRLFVENSRDLGADAFVDGLLEELSRWSDHSAGREPEDDITVVAIHSKKRSQ